MDEEKYNLAGNCVHGLDDPYFRHRVCYDATEMAGIVYLNRVLRGSTYT